MLRTQSQRCLFANNSLNCLALEALSSMLSRMLLSLLHCLLHKSLTHTPLSSTSHTQSGHLTSPSWKLKIAFTRMNQPHISPLGDFISCLSENVFQSCNLFLSYKCISTFRMLFSDQSQKPKVVNKFVPKGMLSQQAPLVSLQAKVLVAS